MEHVAARASESDEGSTDKREEVMTARLAFLRARYGGAFTDEGAQIARKSIEAAVKRDDQIRRVPLGNADEPIGSFVPYRDDSQGGAS